MNGEELIFIFFFLPVQISGDVNQLSVLEIHEALRGSPQLSQLPRGCLGS